MTSLRKFARRSLYIGYVVDSLFKEVTCNRGVMTLQHLEAVIQGSKSGASETCTHVPHLQQ